MVPKKKKEGGWLGLKLSTSLGITSVRTHLAGSPCREQIQTGDEIIAIDGLRVKSVKEINAAIYDKKGVSTELTISREGGIQVVKITPVGHPEHLVKVEGKGNKIWHAIKASRR